MNKKITIHIKKYAYDAISEAAGTKTVRELEIWLTVPKDKKIKVIN